MLQLSAVLFPRVNRLVQKKEGEVTPMAETIGTVDLKIARLERQMQVIEQQLALARMYPNRSQQLILKGSIIQSQLDQLLKRRRNLIVTDNEGPYAY
jgi:hypothetical protein